ncbi:MAG: corrinoid protein [Candidatus Omnitrophica bacterium]|nr:corrinoid protein [Candidatus Omnitrophota bacterium]
MEELKKLLFSGDAENLAREVGRLLGEGTAPDKILNEGLIAGMGVVGGKFKNNEIFIPEVLISADAMQAGMKVLEPRLIEAGVRPIAKVVIGTVKGDLHDIGKNLVSMMLKGSGFQIEDCGIDVPAQKFIETINKSEAQILAMSSLLTTSMPAMKSTIEELEQNGLRGKVKIMVGGAPITEGFAREIGADGYGKDAVEAVDLAKGFLKIGVS